MEVVHAISMSSCVDTRWLTDGRTYRPCVGVPTWSPMDGRGTSASGYEPVVGPIGHVGRTRAGWDLKVQLGIGAAIGPQAGNRIG